MRTYDDDNFYEDSDIDEDGHYGLILVGGAGLLGIVITLVIALIKLFQNS